MFYAFNSYHGSTLYNLKHQNDIDLAVIFIPNGSDIAKTLNKSEQTIENGIDCRNISLNKFVKDLYKGDMLIFEVLQGFMDGICIYPDDSRLCELREELKDIVPKLFHSDMTAATGFMRRTVKTIQNNDENVSAKTLYVIYRYLSAYESILSKGFIDFNSISKETLEDIKFENVDNETAKSMLLEKFENVELLKLKTSVKEKLDDNDLDLFYDTVYKHYFKHKGV